MNRNLVLIISGIFVIAALLFWRPFADNNDEQEQQGYREIKPDFTAQGLIVRVYDANGELDHRIAADEMTHYSPIGLTELTAPTYITQIDDQGALWQVQAEQGSFYADKSLVLERNIEMISLSATEFIERIETSYLTIDTLQETVETEQPVVIYGRDFTVKGEGMRADMRAQTLEMTRHVETIYTGRSPARP
ncbi:LPS export ABC transporter periplasmic protein LptC [Pseudidiomarina woesei]|uniref:Lipopolysaccharide export system protein LptC n=1 Tax=Pseudidiomarina woesei TaxID=1381080 RepID=A0A0K6H7I7_9GAMM|nr:LPS export ABC transporter periplasmic protein LptC [Pseudidiomarina woesei]CUA86947.1 Lipopolysaccharide export system protein LptC [Pseudidiomarina woesei]